LKNQTLYFSYVAAPTCQCRCCKLRTLNKFLITSKTRSTIASLHISAPMTFSTSDFIIGLKRQYPIVATDSEASQHSLLKPNVQKNKGACDRIQSDPAISRYRAPNIDRRQSLPKHITKAVSIKTRLKQVTILRQDENEMEMTGRSQWAEQESIDNTTTYSACKLFCRECCYQ
jgi:hypothetical protein